MIVLDEQLLDPQLQSAIAAWYPGQVINIVDLAPGRSIQDEAIPSILRGEQYPTFVTVNVVDFWERVPADRAYCMVCFALPQDRRQRVPPLLREILALDEFRTKATRMGKVVLVTEAHLRYYQFPTNQIRVASWRSRRA